MSAATRTLTVGTALLSLLACTSPNRDAPPVNEIELTVSETTAETNSNDAQPTRAGPGGNTMSKPSDTPAPPVSKPPPPVEPKLSPVSPPAEVDPPPPNVDVTDPG